jgi:hypothetical protein
MLVNINYIQTKYKILDHLARKLYQYKYGSFGSNQPTCVRSQMLGQCGAVRERFVTMRTRVRSFAGVRSLR